MDRVAFDASNYPGENYPHRRELSDREAKIIRPSATAAMIRQVRRAFFLPGETFESSSCLPEGTFLYSKRDQFDGKKRHPTIFEHKFSAGG